MSDERYMDDSLLINARKPVGELGEKLIEDMNVNHEGLAQWGVSHLNINNDDTILDIGCGGGVNVERFLKMTENMVFGIDYSEVAVEKSKELNRPSIESGRCDIIQASVSNLPFKDNTFDIATAFETVYFWEDFTNDLKEVRRVLKEGGILLIANEALPKDDDRQRHIIDLLDMRIYSADELKSSLQEAGFGEIQIFTKQSSDSFTDEDADWVCAIAK